MFCAAEIFWNMKAIVTCGPSFEPIDQVRRLTNFSTGELGVLLGNQLTRAGFEVFCLKGSGSTYAGPAQSDHLRLFDTNDDLLESLKEVSKIHEIVAVFHVAALCDYKIKYVEDEQGRTCNSPKIASRCGTLTIGLEPATKVIAGMRNLFPRSFLVGWKYELAGTRTEALEKAERQIVQNGLDGCVINGRAFGAGFGFSQLHRPVYECASKSELVRYLCTKLEERFSSAATAITAPG
jgi:phosphopantothenoylcysteine decarboxylase/phosphopantothenate--cysteine ligase